MDAGSQKPLRKPAVCKNVEFVKVCGVDFRLLYTSGLCKYSVYVIMDGSHGYKRKFHGYDFAYLRLHDANPAAGFNALEMVGFILGA